MDEDRLESLARMRVVAEPHRLAVLRRLMAGPATISQLGSALGRHPAWIRHHILALVDVGAVELAEVRKTRNYTEKIYRATTRAIQIHAIIGPEYDGREPLLLLGSDDLAVELLASETVGRDGLPGAITVPNGSLDGLVALRQGLADVAGCHLIDVDSDQYNTPYIRHLFPDRPILVVTLAHREQGLIVAQGNPLALGGVSDIAQEGVRFVNRRPGSGTRVWFDKELRVHGVPASAVAGYAIEVATHREVAGAVASGLADAGIGVLAAAVEAGLGFVPLFNERFDLVFDAARYESDKRFDPLREGIEHIDFKRKVNAIAGYDMSCSGAETLVAV